MASSPYWGGCHTCNLEMPWSYFSGHVHPDLVFEPKWQNAETKDLTKSSVEKQQEKKEEKSDETRELPETRSRRRRATYKRWQLDILEDAFEANCYPSTMMKKFLAERLDMEDIQVQVWFQNRRARLKKDGSERQLPYGRNYPPTLRFDTQSRNCMNRRAAYPYFTRRPGVTPLFSGCYLDHALRHKHLARQVCWPRTVPGSVPRSTQSACDVSMRKLVSNDEH